MNQYMKRLGISTMAILLSTYTWAQDKKLDVDINLNKGNESNWYQQPWVWVVAGAVFILLLVGMLKGKK